MQSIAPSIPRLDGVAKAAGAAQYLADLPLKEALHTRLVLADRAPATVVAVHAPPLPEQYWLVGIADVPGNNLVHVVDDSWPLFADPTVEFVGQPIALIVGPDPVVLADLMAQTHVEYAAIPGRPAPVHFAAARASSDPGIFNSFSLAFERPAAERPTPAPPSTPTNPPTAAAEAPLSVSEEFQNGAQEHVYLEPQAMAAQFAAGKLTVRGSMQCPYYVKGALVGTCAIQPQNVRVIQDTTGGGFGGKEEFPSILACLVAVAAIRTGRTVRLVLERDEDIRISTKRHPAALTLSSTVSPDGVVQDTTVNIDLNAGAYLGLSTVVLQRSLFGASGVYRLPKVQIRARALKTNEVPYGAFRGFGAPQAVFPIEMHLTHLARRRGEDPLRFKRRHILHHEDHTITGGRYREPIVLETMIDRAVQMSDYHRRYREYEVLGARRGSNHKEWRGIGVSIFSHGCGFTGNGEQEIIKARVTLRRFADGRVQILAANVEMGQGAQTTLTKIVARTLGINVEQVEYHVPDTDFVPDSGPTVASRTSMIVGGLLHKAALRLREQPLPAAGAAPQEQTEHYRQPSYVDWDQNTFRGDAYPAYAWGVNIIEVSVDPLSYFVRPLNVWAVYDIGEPLDERIVRGQMHGGIIQALGWASSECFEYRDGKMLHHNLTDYIVPGSRDIPPMHVEFVSNPCAAGPFGAKGAGELPFNGPAPAFAAAVEQAIGRNLYRIPVTPEYIHEVLS